MPRLNYWQSTEAGRAYYGHNRQQLIVNIPITGYKYSDRQGTFIRCTINHLPGGEPLRRVFPYGPNENTEAPDTDGSLEAAQTQTLNNITGWLRSNPIYTEDAQKFRVVTESEIIWVWDEEFPITFDEQVVRHIYSNGRIDFETIMDRPLRGLPVVWEKMYRRMGLCPMATQESDGNCVTDQMQLLLKKRRKELVSGSCSGNRRLPGHVDTRKFLETKVPMYTKEQLVQIFDEIFAALYPGEAVSEEDVDAGLVEAERPYPYQFAGWQEVGVTTKMVAAFCERQTIALRVLYKNTVIFKNDVVHAGGVPVIVYHICGDHAYFYEDRDSKNGAAQLPAGPSKIILRTEELVRIRTRQDEDNMVPFSEMVEYSFTAFMEQIQHGMSKTFYCHQREVKDIKKELEDAEVKLWVGLGNRPELIRSLNLQQKTKKEQKAVEFAAEHFGAFKNQAATLRSLLERLS
jgi:hypothetical protein